MSLAIVLLIKPRDNFHPYPLCHEQMNDIINADGGYVGSTEKNQKMAIIQPLNSYGY
jgi:hypothetical protein